MPLPKLEADELRDCLRITSQLEDKKMREIMARKIEEYIQLGKQFNYLPIKHVPILFFPNDQEKAKAMELSLAAALKSGECSSKYDDRLSASELAGWPTCPLVSADSPLCFWVSPAMRSNNNAAIIETQSQRRARRFKLCIDAGLSMPSNDYGAMPRGVGAIAKKEGITRQAFIEDIKAHIRNPLTG